MSTRKTLLTVLVFVVWAFAGASITPAQVQVGASRLSQGAVKSQIDGAVKDVALWGADICNDSSAPIRIDKGRIRNLLRDFGIGTMGDIDAVATVTQGVKVGKVSKLKRAFGWLTDGCLYYGVGERDWRVLGICAGVKVFTPRAEQSLQARTPETTANLARFTSTPHLELAPRQCGEMVIFASPDQPKESPHVLKAFLSVDEAGRFVQAVRNRATEPQEPSDAPGRINEWLEELQREERAPAPPRTHPAIDFDGCCLPTPMEPALSPAFREWGEMGVIEAWNRQEQTRREALNAIAPYSVLAWKP